jgi:prefoldin subunit 5
MDYESQIETLKAERESRDDRITELEHALKLMTECRDEYKAALQTLVEQAEDAGREYRRIERKEP